MKDFDNWNFLKKNIENFEKEVFCHTREVWWCSIGINIGVETDGKNKNFERPVVVFKVYNINSILIFPITSKHKYDSFHCKIYIKARDQEELQIGFVKVTQVKVVSTKRLIRKMGVVNIDSFNELRDFWISTL